MGELVNMTVTAYKDDTFSDQSQIGESYKVWINPDSYQESITISYSDNQPAGTSGYDLKYNKTLPETLSLKILFDSTGIFPQGNKGSSAGASSSGSSPQKDDKGIVPQIDKFKNITFKMNGKSHEPNYLKVVWGSVDIECRATNMDIDYKLFNPGGFPIRAFVTLTLEKTITRAEREALENRSSPDLTHVRCVAKGDTLPLLCNEVYRDPKYFLEVARVNKIVNFRNLKPGMKIYFPPLKKTSE
ncbi:MAG: LysM peptidoglycan-binding domain-containing protein [Bacteroidota bacterium]